MARGAVKHGSLLPSTADPTQPLWLLRGSTRRACTCASPRGGSVGRRCGGQAAVPALAQLAVQLVYIHVCVCVCGQAAALDLEQLAVQLVYGVAWAEEPVLLHEIARQLGRATRT